MTRRIALLCVLGVSAMLVVVPSAAAGGGCHPAPDKEMTTSNGAVVTIAECSFLDTVVYIEPGQEVRWSNKDLVPHTVSGAAYSWGSERLLEQNDEVAYTFEEEGVFPYYCALHPSMVGAVVVGDATKAVALTNGVAAVVDTSQDVAAAAPASEPTARTGVSAAIGIAILVTIALVVLATRAFALRRRAPSVTPAP